MRQRRKKEKKGAGTLFDNYPGYLSYNYGCENMANSIFSPSEIHFDDRQTYYNFKYLFQRALSVLKFEIPKNWDMNFFRSTLYGVGYLIILNTDEFGKIAQFGNIWGYDLYYQPARATVVNPIFDEIGAGNKYTNMRIWEDCAILRLTPTYTGVTDICVHYAKLLSQAQASLKTNLINSKFAYIFGAKNKTQAESLKRLYDDIASGKPAVFLDKQLYDENGNLSVTMLSQNPREIYLASDILNDMRGVLNDFDSMIGIPNANISKRERLNADEVHQNDFETRALCEVWKESLTRDIERINEMYDLKLSVSYRKGVIADASGTDNTAGTLAN